MNRNSSSIIIITLLFFTSTLLSAQTYVERTIPNEKDQITEYYILEEYSDSTDCYLYLFETTHSYMLIVNYHVTPEFSQSYFLSQGEYSDMNHQLIFHDDVNNLILKARRNEADDLVFEQGLDFMEEATFTFMEKTSQLPGPPYKYHIFPEKIIQITIDQAKTTEYNERVCGSRYQTKMFSNHILADLKLDKDSTFTYSFMHYPLIKGTWQQENQLVKLSSESDGIFYGFIHPNLSDFLVIQLPGFIFNMPGNNLLHKIKE